MIEVKHLTKRYGNHTAVSDLSFTIEKGQVYGFLGPNGAGKSTTMNIMTGCLAASSGEVKIGGYDIFEQAEQAKKLIGYLPELPPLYLEQTPREYLTFVARAKKVPKAEMADEIARVMEITKITDMQDRIIKNLSKGYRQRVGIAQAILGDPEVIILDEPTVGLDPKQIIEIRDLIQDLGASHTVILSSHILSEVQAVCSTILIISKGVLVACDTPENLNRMFAESAEVNLLLECDEEEARRLLADIPEAGEATYKNTDEGFVSVKFRTSQSVVNDVNRNIFKNCCNSGKNLIEMAVKRATLEEIFIELTSGVTPTAMAEESEEPAEEAKTAAEETAEEINEEASAE